MVQTCNCSLPWASTGAIASAIAGANALNRTLNMAIQAITNRCVRSLCIRKLYLPIYLHTRDKLTTGALGLMFNEETYSDILKYQRKYVS